MNDESVYIPRPGGLLAFSLDSCSWDKSDLEPENSNTSARLVEEYCEVLQKYIMSFSLRPWAISEISRGRSILVFCLYGTTVTSSANTVDVRSPE